MTDRRASPMGLWDRFPIAKALLADGWKPIVADLMHSLPETACARLDAPRAMPPNASSWRSPPETSVSQAWAAARTVSGRFGASVAAAIHTGHTGPVNAPLLQASTMMRAALKAAKSRRTRSPLAARITADDSNASFVTGRFLNADGSTLRSGYRLYRGSERSDYIEQEQQELSLTIWNICV
jgi:hypothetical protein